MGCRTFFFRERATEKPARYNGGRDVAGGSGAERRGEERREEKRRCGKEYSVVSVAEARDCRGEV
jgi:hypothetical protein